MGWCAERDGERETQSIAGSDTDEPERDGQTEREHRREGWGASPGVPQAPPGFLGRAVFTVLRGSEGESVPPR